MITHIETPLVVPDKPFMLALGTSHTFGCCGDYTDGKISGRTAHQQVAEQLGLECIVIGLPGSNNDELVQATNELATKGLFQNPNFKIMMLEKISVFRKEHFNAAHRLHVPSWTDAENQAFFGLCNNAHYHGHNYDLEVKVEGQVDPVTGYLIDMKLIKQYIEEEVIEQFDHKNLNLDTEEFRDLNPTAENIVWVIWQKLRARVPQEMNLSVRLYETPRNFVEFNG